MDGLASVFDQLFKGCFSSEAITHNVTGSHFLYVSKFILNNKPVFRKASEEEEHNKIKFPFIFGSDVDLCLIQKKT